MTEFYFKTWTEVTWSMCGRFFQRNFSWRLDVSKIALKNDPLAHNTSNLQVKLLWKATLKFSNKITLKNYPCILTQAFKKNYLDNDSTRTWRDLWDKLFLWNHCTFGREKSCENYTPVLQKSLLVFRKKIFRGYCFCLFPKLKKLT